MSRAKELAYEAAAMSEMKMIDNRTIEFLNASILWPDFSGRITKYHTKEGMQRSFNVVLNDSMLAALNEIEKTTKSKFHIRSSSINGNGQDANGKVPAVDDKQIYYINVKVNYCRQDGTPVINPPVVELISDYRGKKTHSVLDETTVGQIDKANIESIDFRVNCYTRQADPTKCTMYLKKAYVTIEPDIEFGGKYDDWDDAEPVATQPQHIEDPFVADAKASKKDVNPATGE